MLSGDRGGEKKLRTIREVRGKSWRIRALSPPGTLIAGGDTGHVKSSLWVTEAGMGVGLT